MTTRDIWSKQNSSNDIYSGVCSYHVWGALGWHDIKQRYRRSVLGPFWFTITTILMVGVLGYLYSELLQQDIRVYLPYLGIGLVLWTYISTCINEGCNSFIGYSNLIKQIKMPLTVHVCRVVWRNFIILIHSLPVLILLVYILGFDINLQIFLVVLGLFVLLLQGVWVGVVLGILCARYRDVLPIVSNAVQIAFFLTPVMWSPDLLKSRAWVADYNPIYHMVELVRAPLLGRTVLIESWIWAFVILFFGLLLAQSLMQRYRNRIAYWL